MSQKQFVITKRTEFNMNKRHIEKRISLISESILNSNIISDPEYLFLLKKTEKIITATYILSDFIPSNENLKKTLKDNSHMLLNSVCDLLYKRSKRIECVQKVKSSLIKLNAQFSLAEISGFVSTMNANIIKSEISLLIKMIDDFERELNDERSSDLKQNYFYVDTKVKRTYSSEETKTRDIHKGQSKGQSNDYSKTIKSSTTSTENLDRSDKVLDIIRKMGVVSIKDISTQIFDCSEKTIQRTLNHLIDSGKIKKTGERRWAKYQL